MNDIPATKRVIRSFVRRTGRLTQGQQKAIDSLWPVYGIESGTPLAQALSQGQAPNQWQACILEIGFGMGGSLAEMAEQSPQTLFAGIEVHRPGVGHLLKLIEERQLDNIRIYCADAVDILTICILSR